MTTPAAIRHKHQVHYIQPSGYSLAALVSEYRLYFPTHSKVLIAASVRTVQFLMTPKSLSFVAKEIFGGCRRYLINGFLHLGILTLEVLPHYS
jgi:hypothetical protein